MITSFTKPVLRNLRPEIERDLAALGARHGIVIEVGGVRFNGDAATFKVELKVPGADATELDSGCITHGLPTGLMGKQFSTPYGTYTLCGYSRRAHKFPFLGKNAKGKTYKFPVETVRQGLS